MPDLAGRAMLKRLHPTSQARLVNADGSWNDLGASNATGIAIKKYVDLQVSVYAATKPAEMVAEMFASGSTGTVYDDITMALYAALDGPDW